MSVVNACRYAALGSPGDGLCVIRVILDVGKAALGVRRLGLTCKTPEEGNYLSARALPVGQEARCRVSARYIVFRRPDDGIGVVNVFALRVNVGKRVFYAADRAHAVYKAVAELAHIA